MQQMTMIVDAAKRLIARNEVPFTTQTLVKEAGVAMQTFYRHFPGKDQLLLAAIEDLITQQAARYEREARYLTDPLARLRQYLLMVVSQLDGAEADLRAARFITGEHWRLHQLYPAEMEHATRPFADLVARELRAAQAAGLIPPTDPDRTAALMNLLVRSVFHHCAFAGKTESVEEIGERLWAFCLGGIGAGGYKPQATETDGDAS
jgi:AcrR family transcriptional regulator